VLHLKQAAVRGGLPHLLRLLPLAKPCSGVRPIAVGEVWYLLAALCDLATCPNAGGSLLPLQVAIGNLRGSQIVAPAIHDCMSADPSCMTRQVDWQNALTPCIGTTCWRPKHRATLPCCPWPLGPTDKVHRTGCGRAISSGRPCLPSHCKGLEEVAAMGLA
jgi:hypothetical protein